jgi:excisionase family DNA binding protein
MKNNSKPEAEAAFMTLAEVQTYLNIRSRKTLLSYIHKGNLPAVKMGGTRWRIARKAVEAFMKRYSVNGMEHAPI